MAMRSLSGRTDADYASVVEVFDNLSHAEIHHAVRQLDPAALVGAAETFLTTATGLGDGVEIAHGEIRAAIADGWRGAAAEQASDAVRDFEQAGRRIADVLTAVGVRLSQAGDAAESIRAAVSEPTGAQPDPSAALLDSDQAANNATIAREAENARLDAVRAMETIYAGVFLPTGSGVPAFAGITTETGTAAAGSAPSGAVPSAGIPPAAAVIASATAPANTAAATVPAGYSPVAGQGTTPSSNGAPTIGTSAAPGVPANGTSPATLSAATSTSSQALPNSGGASATTPASTTATSFGTAPVANRPRPTADTARAGSATTNVEGSQPDSAPDALAADSSQADSGPSDTVSGSGSSATTSAAADISTGGQVTGASATGTTEAASDGRQERDTASAGGEAAAGMGAGAIGGMMGGAIAAADQTRPAGGPRPAPPVEEPEDEEDEFLRYLEDEPTYLEPADEVNALIGKMEPTSPAVLGEWTERE